MSTGGERKCDKPAYPITMSISWTVWPRSVPWASRGSTSKWSMAPATATARQAGIRAIRTAIPKVCGSDVSLKKLAIGIAKR